MKITLLRTIFCLIVILPLIADAQTSARDGMVLPFNANLKEIPMISLPAPDREQLRIQDEERDRNGELYRIGVALFTNITPANSGTWKNLPNGARQWQLRVKSEGAEALSFLFEVFKVYDGSTFTVQDLSGIMRHKPMTDADVQDHGRQNAALCFGDDFVLTLTEPYGARQSEIYIDRIMYGYRSTGNPTIQKINESDACEVNVNCSPVGDTWQDEKRGVARILVVDGNSQGWCSGSLVNNVAQNCKPLFLTALHCGVTSTTANFTQWVFYFRYESPNCSNPSTAGTLDDNFITGSVKLASSNDGGGTSGSDFLLVQLGSLSNEAATINTLKSAAFNAYWNGWDANNTTTNSGAGIHHPAGDIKKISTFSANLVSAGWNGNGLQSHWRVNWSSNANGWGVTEGGSSGSPIFKTNGGNSVIIGTLTGGSSFCNAQGQPDFYGKMSYHWTSNGTPANEQLKTYLDPNNTGTLTLLGSADPCSVPQVPVANFSANQTNVTPGTTVSFTDLTSGVPTSWAWSISPGTGWAFAGGTTASSQNPQITFNTVGQYTIQLTASNAQGSDVEIKNNYIIVAQSTGPCTATSTTCDEFIQNVFFNTINNTTACTNYTSYTSPTTVNKGSSYNMTVTPQITGQAVGSAYVGNELGAWIDFNNDGTFANPAERVYYLQIQQTTTAPEFTQIVNIPTGSTTGTVKMRVRITYNGTSGGEGPVDPCGTTQYGEVEDYNVQIQAAAAGVLSLQCPGNQTIYATQSTVVPNITATATSSTTCAGGTVTETQTPSAGTPLQNGQNTITVTATDQCGNTQTCSTVITYINNLGIGENDPFQAVAVYPNPVSEELIVDLSVLAEEQITIELYDLSGKLLSNQSVYAGSPVKLNMSAFSNGMYQLRLMNAHASSVRRVLKF
jgi:lysyl endopeptidase